jgi:hypothetical protein
MTARWMPGEVSTRAGGLMVRLTSLPRRQAAIVSLQFSGADGGPAGHRASQPVGDSSPSRKSASTAGQETQ